MAFRGNYMTIYCVISRKACFRVCPMRLDRQKKEDISSFSAYNMLKVHMYVVFLATQFLEKLQNCIFSV